MNQFLKANIIGYSGTLIKCELARVFLSVREVCYSPPSLLCFLVWHVIMLCFPLSVVAI